MKAGLPRLVGVIHLPALPGAPGSQDLLPADALARAGEWAVREATILKKAGFDGVAIENFGDAPFYKERVPPETVAAMSVIVAAVREVVPSARLGVNVLRNDGASALAIAAVTGADWIRVNVLSGVAATDQGLIEGQAAALLRERARLGARTAIFADVHVKHARSLSSTSMELGIEEAFLRAQADAVIVTGETTGRLIDEDSLREASRAARAVGAPLYLGSGTTRDSLARLSKLVDGIIVGSAIRRGKRAGAPLDARLCQEFAKEFMKNFKKAKSRGVKR